MKKLLCVLFCAALATGLLAGCETAAPDANAPQSPLPLPTAGLPNPMTQVESAVALTVAGVNIDAPALASNQAYTLIGDTLAQIGFTLDGAEYTYRASAAEQDISGVYEQMTDRFLLQVLCDGFTVNAKVSDASSGGRLVTWAHGNVSYSLWTASPVEDGALKDAVLGVMVNTFGSTAAAETGFSTLDFTDNMECNLDLDGDGYLENVKLETYLDEYGSECVTLTVSGPSGSTQSAALGMLSPSRAIASDFDGDGLVELFVTGDCCSNDYATWCFRYDKGALIPSAPYYEPQEGDESGYLPAGAPGALVAVEENRLVIADNVNILGTWLCRTQYTLAADAFALEREKDSVWAYESDCTAPDYWEYGTLVTKAEFPVRMDGAPADASLPIGTVIKPTETDGETWFRFITIDGDEGVITVGQPSEYDGAMFAIGGIDETDCFEYVPYAG